MTLGFDWSGVTVATIAAVASIINAFIAASVWKQIRTPSGTHIGKQMESVHHVALGNSYRIQRMQKDLGSIGPDEAEREDSKVHPPNER